MTTLDEVVPSVELLRALTGLDRASLDVEQQLSAVAAWERIIGFATACQNELLADVVSEVGPESRPPAVTACGGSPSGSASRWESAAPRRNTG